MSELFILQPIEDMIQNPEKEGSSYRRKVRRGYDGESSLEMLDKFKKIAEVTSLEVLDEYNHLGVAEIEFIDFILQERIRKKLDYLFFLDLGDGFHQLFFPECPSNLLYKNMIYFKSNLERLEKDMIRFINKQKNDKIFNHYLFGPRIYIYCKVEKKIGLINEFIDHFSMTENDLYRIKFEIFDKSSQPIEDLAVLTGSNKHYVSIKGKASDLRFLLFVKEYFSRF